MFLTEIFEQQTTKHAAFCFGRMNPPTAGHGQLINTVASASQGGDYFIFVSQTQDRKKNPLDYATKVKFVKALFPQNAGHVVYDPELKTIMQVANWLYSKGYRSVTFVAGSDRLASFKELLTKYNGQEDGYKFDSINFVSSGDRDPDADGIAGVSASSAREAASQGNFEQFAQATGAGKLAKPLYDAVRKGMLLEGWKDAAIGAAMLGTVGGAMYAQPHPKVEIDGVKWTITSRTPGILAHAKVVTAADGKQYQVWRGPKNRHLAHPIEKPLDENSNKVEELKREIEQLKKMITNPRGRGVASMRKHLDQLYKDLEKARTVSECSGYIPKNKKEAKDPRWSNALTVDVHPDTPTKNMKALGLI